MLSQLVFLVFLLAGFGFFVKTLQQMVRAAARGVPEPRARLDQIPARVASVIIYFFGQKKVAEEGPGRRSSRHHLGIFWGFLIITAGTAETLVQGVWPSFTYDWLMPHVAFVGLKHGVDFMNAFVLLLILYSFFRRIVLKPALIPMNLDAALILGAIASLMITHFLYQGLAAAAGNPHGPGFISEQVAKLFTPDAQVGSNAYLHFAQGAAVAADTARWVHVFIVLVFMNYLPYSKHIHLLGAMPNIFTRNLSQRTLDMPKLDLEDDNQWGVGRYEQFSWKSLIDNYACTECARCSNNCPAYGTGKNLSPMQLVHDIRYEMIDRDRIYAQQDELKVQIAGFGGDDHGHKHPDQEYLEGQLAALGQKLEDMPPLVGGRIAEDTLWACTTCGACQEVCPVFIEHPLKILQMRQNLVLEQEKVPAELARTFRNIERQSNPWGISSETRMDWAKGLDVPTIEDVSDPEYILWVGCAGSFDNRIIKQTRAMIKVLTAAEVDYAVLGNREGCTGDPARRGGNEFLFQTLAEQNVEILNEVGAKKIITSCPHCLHTLRHDYPQFGGEYEVVHHTQLIARLIADGKLDLQGKAQDKITYHDSCYLGRWNKEFSAPRDILGKLPSTAAYVELEYSKRYGLCCGAGGARMFMEEDEPRVNEKRAKQIIDAGVDTVAVACPYCSIMLTDGMKHYDKEEDIRVLDVAELVADSIPDVSVGSLVRHKQ